MARKHSSNPTAEALEEIEHLGDRLVERISANPVPVLAVLGAILLIAGTVGGVRQWRGHQAEAATAAFEEVRAGFFEAMGANPNALSVPEPANPETGRQVRSEYAERFAAVAEELAGTPAAALALGELGQLRVAQGETDAAIEAWRRGAEGAADRPELRGLLLQRVAQAEEDAGRLERAAETYEEVAAIGGYPLGYQALAQAARIWADAGDPDRAIALFKRVRAESPETLLPDPLAAKLRELEAAPR